ncbi:hypothetical protein N658DRAFT_99346 [Parathielavia hyrcaniae]|uniref:Uncharacterized protein n=1 Tax=Parathielavia hyrcaniae TaxID=113614 RepID=A0AAN6Q0M1_9PEZI|nr:hypothetical protein N658DRAFT_99346 [Parathielavia hyrcaniae]
MLSCNVCCQSAAEGAPLKATRETALDIAKTGTEHLSFIPTSPSGAPSAPPPPWRSTTPRQGASTRRRPPRPPCCFGSLCADARFMIHISADSRPRICQILSAAEHKGPACSEKK